MIMRCAGFWKVDLLAWLQKDFLQAKAMRARFAPEPLSANRGRITESNGAIGLRNREIDRRNPKNLSGAAAISKCALTVMKLSAGWLPILPQTRKRSFVR